MKIAIIGTRGLPARYSGIETAVEEVAERLSRRNFQMIIYCRKRPPSGLRKEFNKNIKLVYLPTVNTKHLSTLLHTLMATCHSLFCGAKIVHFHALGSAPFSFLPRLFGKKSVVSIHGLDWKRRKWGLIARAVLKLCEYPAIFFPNKTIVVSKTLKNYFEIKLKKFKGKLIFISNGISISDNGSAEKNTSSYSKYLLFVGRITPEKGIHYLIKAFNGIESDFKLIIAGTAIFADRYVSELKKLAPGNVIFTGFVDNETKRSLYQNAYLFVLPSDVEGMPMSLLEAMSHGKCVLVSHIPECLEIIEDCGISFKPGDYLDLKEVGIASHKAPGYFLGETNSEF